MRLQTTETNRSIKTKSKTKNQSKKIVESLPYKIKDIKLAKLGRDKINISEKEIPGLMELESFKYIEGMTIPTCNTCWWCNERQWAESRVEETIEKIKNI